MLILGQIYSDMNVLACYIDPSGIETKIPSNAHTILALKKYETLIIDTQMVL